MRTKQMKFFLLIIIILITNSSAMGQAKGPTKEQTVQFIKDYYEGKSFSCTEWAGSAENRSTNDAITVDFNYSSNIMIIQWKYKFSFRSHDTKDKGAWDHDDFYKRAATIDFNKVEEITLQSDELGNCKLILANLKAASGHKQEFTENYYTIRQAGNEKQDEKSETKLEKGVSIPLNAYSNDISNDFETNKKILQAFNHLRKLCGSPDPIKFD